MEEKQIDKIYELIDASKYDEAEVEIKKILEDCFTYNLNIKSLRKELESVNDKKLHDKIVNEINCLTEKVMNVRTLIDSLDGSSVRLVMRMRYINLMSFKDIANELNVTYQWVNKLHNDGLEQLSKML